MDDSEPISSEEGPEPKMIKSKRVRAKLMSVEEAAMQMDLLENNFLVFTNANSKTLNIIYRLKDGHYGLIEPQVD
jgi:putative sigma-54 modulation protein